jgi:hypothetical protein
MAACTPSVRRIAVSLALIVAIGCSSGSSNNGPQGSGGGGGSTGTGGTSGGAGGTTGAGGAAIDGGASGGAPGTGGAGADGGTGTGAPIILSLATNVMTLTPSGSLIVTAVVTHPQGIAQVIGGTLNDPSGASYGAFMVSTTSGSYSVTLSWGAIEAVQDINAGSGGVSRTFAATFYDQAGHMTTKTFNIQLQCPTATDPICGGTCHPVQFTATSCGPGCSPRNCVTLYPSLADRACSTQGKCSGTLTSMTLQSCNAACQSAALMCTGTNVASYRNGGSTTTDMDVDCGTVPPANLSGTSPFDSLTCNCTE